MDNRSKLNPELLIGQATWAIHFLQKKMERLREARVPMVAFINATELNTRGIRNLKQKMSDTLQIMNALILAYSSYMADYRRLITMLEGVPIIDGHIILETISRTETNIRNLEDRMRQLNAMRNMPGSLPNRSIATHNQLGDMIRAYERTWSSQRAVLRALNARVEQYNEIEHLTSTMLREGSEFESEAMRGFEMVNQAARGLPNSFSHAGLSAWRVSLQEKKDQREGSTLEEIDFIDSIRSSGTSFPEYWNEERKLEFARQFFSDMALIDTFLNEHYPIYDFSEDFESALARRTAFFFLMDHSLAFNLNLNQRKELLNILEGNTMAGPVEDFFVNLGYSNRRGSGGLFLNRQSASKGAHARNVYVAAQDGSTYTNWFAGLAMIGGIFSINSLSNAGLAPMVAPPNPAHPRGWMPNRPITPPATPNPKSPVQSSSNLPSVRTITLSNGRVVRLSSTNGQMVRGNLQNPNIPRMINVNGKWVRQQISPNAQNHLIKIEGYNRHRGFVGGHNMINFNTALGNRGGLL